MNERFRMRAAIASLTLGVAAPLAYVAIRVYERRNGFVDPLMVMREVHTGYYWRCALAAWIGLVAAAVVAQLGASVPADRRAAAACGALFAVLAAVTWALP